MKKIVITTLILTVSLLKAQAQTSPIIPIEENSTKVSNSIDFTKEHTIQTKIDNIGIKLLNANKIERRIIFTYKPNKKRPKVAIEPALTKRQIIYYDEYFKYTENDDEIAGLLAREISKAVKSYDGAWGGFIDSAQIKMAPKKYEIFADKRAVDYMVHAGYNPLGLITLLHKAYPQKRNDKFACSNLTSKRLANIYEYIFIKYPQFLINNTYIGNETYQNFLLTSTNNRIKLQHKIKSGSKDPIKYE